MRSLSLLPLLLLLPALPSLAQRSPAPDFAVARQETTDLLSALIRINTTNPPGNETQAAQYLQKVLEREGIPSEIFELERGRGNLVARLKGNGAKKPLLLMGHLDVVGVEREQWSVDPFAGLIQGDYLYGRGAIDDKDGVAACLETFLLLHRLHLPLERDVIFLADAGEEFNSRVGIAFMIDQHWDKIAAEFALNEGGSVRRSENGEVQYLSVGTTEKVPQGFRLVAHGTGGHASVPLPDNPIAHLAAALARISAYQAPVRLNPTTRRFFQSLATIASPQDAYLYTHLEDPETGLEAQQQLRRRKPRLYSMLHTSISPTIIKGGFRNNVIPTQAEAFLDVRALPDEDLAALAGKLRELVDDPAIEVIPPSYQRPIPTPSGLDTAMFHALESAQRKIYPGAFTVPAMGTGATDSARLRAKGIEAYGVGPVVADWDSRAHGNDERIRLEDLGQFVEFLFAAVTSVASPQ